MKEKIKTYENQQKVDGETLQGNLTRAQQAISCNLVCCIDLKDTVEKLDDDMHDNQQTLAQLKQENAKLNKLLHEKEEQLKRRWVNMPIYLLYIFKSGNQM